MLVGLHISEPNRANHSISRANGNSPELNWLFNYTLAKRIGYKEESKRVAFLPTKTRVSLLVEEGLQDHKD